MISFGDWFTEQHRDIQDSMIGSTNGKAWRDGSMSTDKLISVAKNPPPMTLDQLESQNIFVNSEIVV